MCNNDSKDIEEWCFNKKYQYDHLKPYFVNPDILLKQHDLNKPRSYLLIIFGFLSFFFLALTLVLHGRYQCSKGYSKGLAYTILIGEFFIVFLNCLSQAYISTIPCYLIFLIMSIGIPLIFLGVVGKTLILYVEYINTLKKEKINSIEKYSELFMKSDLNRINYNIIKDSDSSAKISFTSIPKNVPLMKYITERNLLIFVYVADAICVIYSYFAQKKSKFYRITSEEYGYCNHGPWEFIPLYAILYISTIVSCIIYSKLLYLRNRKVKLSKKMFIYILIGLVIFIVYLGFSYSPTLHHKFFFISVEMILSIFVIYVHVLFIGAPVYRMLNMVYLQENLNKSMDSLNFVLENPELCNEFSKYCTVELCIENLLFHKRILKLKEEMEEYENIKLNKSKKDVIEYEREKLFRSHKGRGNNHKINIDPSGREEGGLEVIYEYYNDFYNRNERFPYSNNKNGSNLNISNSSLNDIDEIKSYKNNVKSNYIPIIFIPEVKEIYKKFIAHNSIFEINISNSIYQKISNELNHGDEEYILKNIFDEADKEVLNILYTNIYHKFIKTQKSKNLFSDLELMINNKPTEE